MRLLALLLCVTLSACGAGSSDTVSTSKPQSTPPPVVSGPVVFMGDSITAFWDGGGFITPDPLLSQLVPGEVNAGISGNRTDQMLARFPAVLAQHPAVLVILGGTNDIRQIENPTIDNIATMAEEASATGARVVIGTVPPASVSLYPTTMDQATNNLHIATFNAELKTLCATYGYTLVDYNIALVNVDGSQNQTLFVSTDLIHPNVDGYRAMWPMLRKALVSLNVPDLHP